VLRLGRTFCECHIGKEFSFVVIIVPITYSKYPVEAESRIFSLKHGRTYSKHYALKGCGIF
jgi:hypothetical protein